jgi:hypothetical protein
MTSSARGGRFLLACVALGLAGAIAGCAGSSGSTAASAPGATSAPASGAGASATGTATSSAASGATSSPGASSSPGGGAAANHPDASSSPGNPGAQPCSTRYLRAEPGTSQGAAGSLYLAIKFVNLNNAPCTLYGFPGVSLAGGTPVTQVGAAADRWAGAVKTTVLLQPQGVASATLRIVQAADYPAASCGPRSTTYLQIFPPDQLAPLYMPLKATACTRESVHLLTINVVKPGSAG